MNVWHLTADTPRAPRRVSATDWVTIEIGTWPIEWAQVVWVEVEATHADGTVERDRAEAEWRRNQGENSYWAAELGPFRTGDVVRYVVRAHSPAGAAQAASAGFTVGPKLHLALLWHQHQPLYRDAALPSVRGSYLQSTVRRHAIRDYYSMAALVAEHPGVHLTISLTPALLSQIDEYVTGDATDRALELTQIPAEALSQNEQEEVLRTFFDAHLENQIRPHARYAELYDRARGRARLRSQDLRDLQMWFNLAWFAKEFREHDVTLVTGEVVSVHDLVDRGRDYTVGDIERMLGEQMKIMRGIIPIHRMLQERGQIEVATSPYFHPILPLLIDSDAATIDRPGTTRPRRFTHPEDADAQVRLAVEAYRRWFGRPPRGMWPAEGAVSQSVVPVFARHGIRWIASDRGVLARSGRWGYPADDADAICRPSRAEEGGAAVAIFFRDAWLSDHIGFHYQHYGDYREAAREFLRQVKQRYAWRLEGEGDRVLTVILDGENAWSAYRDDARPFLHALYELLERDAEIRTVTCSEYLDGSAGRGVAPHPARTLGVVHDLFTGSWTDEPGSAPGVDLGTWIGEPEENDAWELLGEVRAHLRASGATPESAPEAYRAMYAAEGSDWFWWLGADHQSGRDAELDQLFHAHLRAVYLGLGETAPPHVTPHPDGRTITWSPTCRLTTLAAGERLLVRSGEPGIVRWRIDGGEARAAPLLAAPAGVVGVAHWQRLLGPFPPGARRVRVRLVADAAAPGRPPTLVGETLIRIGDRDASTGGIHVHVSDDAPATVPGD